MDNKALPRAVYRLQLNPDFTFVDARNIVPYLHTLVSVTYISHPASHPVRVVPMVTISSIMAD